MKDNALLRGLVPLERLFDANDIAVNQKKENQDEQVEDCNLGTQQEPKMIKLFKGVSKDYKERYVDLFKQFQDVFAWSYDDLKTYDKSIIQHKIPLKDGFKPHKQKLQQINPLLLAPIEKEVKILLQAKIIVSLDIQIGFPILYQFERKTER